MSEVNDYLHDEVAYWRNLLAQQMQRCAALEAERDEWMDAAKRGVELCEVAVAALKSANDLIELYGCCNPN